MFSTRMSIRCGIAVAAALLVLFPACLQAGDAPVDETLKSHGLKRAGDVLVHESETLVKNKVREIRLLTRQLGVALAKQEATVGAGDYQQTVKSLSDQINQYKTELNTVNQQLNSFPRYRGRLLSNYATQEYQDLTDYRSQLQAELNQDSQYLNQIKSQPPDPRAREKIAAEVQDKKDSLRQAVVDLRELVDKAQAKYSELGKNDEVLAAVRALGTGSKVKPKLGPSHEFSTDVKLLEKLEADESSAADPTAQAKHGRASRRSVKGKRGPRPAPAAPATTKTDDGR